MKSVIFDLDDTLYPEMTFVESGFAEVARHLSSCHDMKEDSLLERMLDILGRDGRGSVFNTLLQELRLHSDDMVKLLVYVYRSHRPSIDLYDDAEAVLRTLRASGFSLGIVTDGMGSVQRRKIQALGLEDLVDVVVCSDELGAEDWKPSVVPFKVALELMQLRPADAAYVGDDITKDFTGPNSLGMLTLQIDRGGAESREPDRGSAPPVGASKVVANLLEIVPLVGG